MDGNQRWSKQNNKNLNEGYVAGMEKLYEIIKFCISAKIQHLTVYALSTENISRPSVSIIYDLIKNEYKNLLYKIKHDAKVKINIIGEKKNLPPLILNILNNIIHETKYNTSLNLNIAFNYGTDHEIIHIIKSTIKDEVKIKNISSKLIKKYMYLNHSPDPNILIRTGGYQRLSNFLLLNLKYTELYFTKTLWPDLTTEEINNYIKNYSKIKKSYGL